MKVMAGVIGGIATLFVLGIILAIVGFARLNWVLMIVGAVMMVVSAISIAACKFIFRVLRNGVGR